MKLPGWQPSPRALAGVKALLVGLSLLPAGGLLLELLDGGFGEDTLDSVTRGSGTWTLNLLLVTLSITPARKLLGWPWLVRLRQPLGLLCFAYACLHFLTFAGLDHGFGTAQIVLDVVERPFVIVGFAAFLLLWPLALTSNRMAVRWLGGRRWQRLHRSIYAVGILATIHYLWLSEPSALLRPLLYALVLGILLGYRARARIRAFSAAGGSPPGKDATATWKRLEFHRRRPPQ